MVSRDIGRLMLRAFSSCSRWPSSSEQCVSVRETDVQHVRQRTYKRSSPKGKKRNFYFMSCHAIMLLLSDRPRGIYQKSNSTRNHFSIHPLIHPPYYLFHSTRASKNQRSKTPTPPSSSLQEKSTTVSSPYSHPQRPSPLPRRHSQLRPSTPAVHLQRLSCPSCC